MDISSACVMASHVINGIFLTCHAKPHAGGSSPQIARVQELRAKIHKFGIDITLCSDPNIQYAAARFWKTSHPEDRIYAIMQIYGQSWDWACPKGNLKQYSLKDLGTHYLQTLNFQFVVLVQALRHLEAPQQGHSWSVVNYIHVPRATPLF